MTLFVRFYAFDNLCNMPDVIPDELYYYSANELHSIISVYTETNKHDYMSAAFSVDLLYMSLYGLLGFVLVTLVFNKLKINPKLTVWVRFIPLLSSIADLTENIIVSWLIKHLPEFNNTLASAVGRITLFKWGNILLAIIVFLIIIISKIFFCKVKK